MIFKENLKEYFGQSRLLQLVFEVNLCISVDWLRFASYVDFKERNKI